MKGQKNVITRLPDKKKRKERKEKREKRKEKREKRKEKREVEQLKHKSTPPKELKSDVEGLSQKKARPVLLPQYAVFPLLAAFVMNMFCYNVSRLITRGMTHYCLQFDFEKNIPLYPPAIWIYVLAFAQWMISYVVIARQQKDTAYRLISADIWAKCITMVIFIVLPTTVQRPACTGSDVSSIMLRAIWGVDPSNNLFPSIHCIESWLCFRATFYMRSCRLGYRGGMFLFTVLVFASVILTEQHTLVDIPAGMLMVEAGLLLSKSLRFDALFDRMEKLIYSRKNTCYEKE